MEADIRQIRKDLAELADLIVMVASNSHTAYFSVIQDRANAVINRSLEALRQGGDDITTEGSD